MADLLRDPVCGMDVTPQSAAGKSEFQGNMYYFCSLGCQDCFDEGPEKYLSESSPVPGH